MTNVTPKSRIMEKIHSIKKEVKLNYEIYLLLMPTFIIILIFKYFPMYGIQIAFKSFNPIKGISGSNWVGFKYFVLFLEGPFLWQIMRNTFTISIYDIIAGFPLPIIFALLLNHQKNLHYKKIVQTVSYAPHFISTVVLVGMLKIFTAPEGGLFNILIKKFGGETIHFMGVPDAFYHMYVWSGIWQNLGWSAIIYIGALSAINPELHEAAIVDGATIWKRIWYVDIPGILPTIITLLILKTGGVLSVGFEKAYLMQNAQNASVSEVISTYVYKKGLLETQYSYSSAVGLFNSVINFTVLVIVNAISRKVSEISLI